MWELSYPQTYEYIPDDYFRDLTIKATAAMRDRGFKTPVLTVARFREVAQAESMIAEGHADMVGMGRALLADPDIVNKSREGREDEVVPCTSCNQGCLGRNWTALPITCMSNPAVGREAEWPVPQEDKASRRKSVLVVGGGPAGLEAAHVAASRGHQVTIWEASDQLGGQLAVASRFAKRTDLSRIVDSLVRRCEAANVRIETGREATGDLVSAFGADEVIVATGSSTRPVTSGTDERTLTVSDFARDFNAVGRKVAVYDLTGGYTMMAVMEQLMATGRNVALVTPGGTPGWGIVPYSLYGLTHRFREHSVRMHPMRKLESFENGNLVVADAICGETESLGSFDQLIVVDHCVARDEYRHWAFTGQLSWRAVGDCLAPRSAIEAIFEGHEAARSI